MAAEKLNFQIINHIDEGVIALDQGKIVHVNAAMETMTGIARHELRNHALDELFIPPPPLDIKPIDHHPDTNTRQPVVYESSLQTANGQCVEVAVSVHDVMGDKTGEEFIIVRNIADQKKMQRELLKSRQLESIAALSGGIAHDYNNLLTAIMGNISLALTSISEEDPIFEWLSQAQDASLIAKELTRRLITFSKGGAPQKTAVNLIGLIQGATEFALSGSNIIAEFSIPPELWGIEADRTQMGQAFHNIVINAREAMPDGGTLWVTAVNKDYMLDGKMRKAGKFVAVTIKDSGHGIPAEALDRIFDPYFSTKELGDQRGMGLGLSIANSIVEKHDGKIVAESLPGQGALFEVYLPAASTIYPKAPVSKPTERTAKLVASGKILVMDDEAMIRKLAGNILGKLGFDVEFAVNGEEAIAAYQAALDAHQRFDAVILDLTVKGGLGGKDTIKRLCELDPGVKAIVSSGYSNDPGVTHYTEYGFAGVVAKPYRIHEIREQLNAILA